MTGYSAWNAQRQGQYKEFASMLMKMKKDHWI
jgi:hypothetical protein